MTSSAVNRCSARRRSAARPAHLEERPGLGEVAGHGAGEHGGVPLVDQQGEGAAGTKHRGDRAQGSGRVVDEAEHAVAQDQVDPASGDELAQVAEVALETGDPVGHAALVGASGEGGEGVGTGVDDGDPVPEPATRTANPPVPPPMSRTCCSPVPSRGDSAFGTKKVITACLDEQIEFSLTLSRNRRVTKAIDSIDETEWTPVHYPGAVLDPDTGALISDAEVAETGYTLSIRGHGRIAARLVVRRVKDARYPDALFPVWRYHPFFTNSELPTAEADLTHRRHAIVETTFADLIDGPLAHIPSGLFAANCAWLACAVIAHNLLRAAGTIAGGDHAVARGATLRRDLVTVPARFAAPARKPTLHLPAHWPWQIGWKTLWDNIIGYSPVIPRAG